MTFWKDGIESKYLMKWVNGDVYWRFGNQVGLFQLTFLNAMSVWRLGWSSELDYIGPTSHTSVWTLIRYVVCLINDLSLSINL